MDRRNFVRRIAAFAAAGVSTQTQRLTEPAVNAAAKGIHVLEYVVSRDQILFTLIRQDGTQVRPDQVIRVIGSFRSGQTGELLREQYQFEGWSLVVDPAVADWLDRLTVVHR